MSKLAQKFNRILDGFVGLGSYGSFEDEKQPVVLTKEAPVDSQTESQETQKSKKTGTALWDVRRHKDLVMGSKILSGFPLPLRQPRKNLDSDYERKVNEFTYRIVSSNKYGYPFGQDALILLVIEDLARKAKNRKICIDSIWQLLKNLGIGDGNVQYKRFLEAIKRLANSRFSVFENDDDSTAVFLDVFEAIHLKGITEDWKAELGNFILLREEHFQRVIIEEVPYDMEVFRRLTHSAGASRMYRFVAPRAFAAAASNEGVVWIRVDELLNQLGCESYSRRRQSIQQIKEWKAECDEALIATGMGPLPLNIDDHGRVSIFPKHLVPGVTAVVDSKAVVQRPSHAKHKETFKPRVPRKQKPKEFDIDWVLEQELEDWDKGLIKTVSPAAAQYSSEKAAYLENNQPE